MRIRYSLFTRRKFLNALLGGWLLAFLSSLVYPVIRFLFPPYREPDSIMLPSSIYRGMAPHTARTFAWGSKPGILVRKDDRYQAFIAVCTHLGCTVSFLSEKRMFYCACHEGWFDENGVNVAGPPPSPLRELEVEIEDEDMIIHK